MADAFALLLGDHEARLAEWAKRVRAVGYRVVWATTTQDAVGLAEERGTRFGAALVDSEIPTFDLRGALEELRRHPCAEGLRVRAIGLAPTKRDCRDCATPEPSAHCGTRSATTRCASC
jgi:CheY-like chemotaxis protein